MPTTTTEQLIPTAEILCHLLDHIRNTLDLKNDAALARALEVAPPVISKLRRAKLPFGPVLILKLHELHGFPVADIRARLAGEVA